MRSERAATEVEIWGDFQSDKIKKFTDFKNWYLVCVDNNIKNPNIIPGGKKGMMNEKIR